MNLGWWIVLLILGSYLFILLSIEFLGGWGAALFWGGCLIFALLRDAFK